MVVNRRPSVSTLKEDLSPPLWFVVGMALGLTRADRTILHDEMRGDEKG